MSKTLFIIRGLPSPSRGEIAARFTDNPDNVFSADDYFIDDEGNFEWVPEQAPDAHRYCKNAVQVALQDSDDNVVVHNVFSKLNEVRQYVDMARIAKVPYEIIEISTVPSQLEISYHVASRIMKYWECGVNRV